MDDKGSVRNVDGPSVLKIELHVPRRELDQKFEIVRFAENAPMELKSQLTTCGLTTCARFRRHASNIDGAMSVHR
jgi:hypothetical protein